MQFDLGTSAAGGLVVAVALAMAAAQAAAGKKLRTASLDDAARAFYRAQLARRLCATGGLAAAGIAVFCSQWISARESPGLFVAYWCAIMVMLAAICGAAILDLAASRVYFGRLDRQQQSDQVKLSSEVRQRKPLGENGQH